MPKKSGKTTPSVKKTAKAVSVPKTRPSDKPRRLKQRTYKSFQLQKRIKHPIKIPNVVKLTKSSVKLAWQHKKLFTGIILIYGLLNLIFVRGLAGGSDLGSLKDSFDQVFQGNFGSLASGLGVFITLVGSSGNSSSDTAGAYQTFLGLIASLAVIWALRQVMAGSYVRVRDAYYKGMYPLIPFILVVMVIGLQLIPLFAGVTLYSLVVSNGIAVGGGQFAWFIFCILLSLLSLYMISSSIFALYIVTLPDMTPLKALRSARELVRYRRWTVLRKVLWLPLYLLLVAAVIMLPIIIWLTVMAQWIFFILTMVALLAVHAYMYTLYRELLNE
jgi:hypothetical protein